VIHLEEQDATRCDHFDWQPKQDRFQKCQSGSKAAPEVKQQKGSEDEDEGKDFR
jgi:hypothetical protein